MGFGGTCGVLGVSCGPVHSHLIWWPSTRFRGLLTALASRGGVPRRFWGTLNPSCPPPAGGEALPPAFGAGAEADGPGVAGHDRELQRQIRLPARAQEVGAPPNPLLRSGGGLLNPKILEF